MTTTPINLHTWGAAIKDGNADHATCCVYADWLEEQGVRLSATWRSSVYLTPIGGGYGDGVGGGGYGYGGGYGDGVGGGGYGYGDGGDGDGGYGGGGYGGGVGGGGYGGGGYGDGDGDGDGGYGYGGGYGFELIKERRFIVDGTFIFRVKDRWSFFGSAKMDPNDSTRLIIDNCKCIRIWGTTKGIGQLAIEGPTKDSVIDPMGDGVSLLRSEISFAIPVSEQALKAWGKVK